MQFHGFGGALGRLADVGHGINLFLLFGFMFSFILLNSRAPRRMETRLSRALGALGDGPEAGGLPVG